jgi:hypothetical protein
VRGLKERRWACNFCRRYHRCNIRMVSCTCRSVEIGDRSILNCAGQTMAVVESQ